MFSGGGKTKTKQKKRKKKKKKGKQIRHSKIPLAIVVGFVKDKKDPFVYTLDKSTSVVDRLKMNKKITGCKKIHFP